MGNTLTKTQRIEREQARLDYLQTHPAFRAIPGRKDRVSPRQYELLSLLVKDMQMRGLYAHSCAPAICRWGIRALVSRLRGSHL